MLTAIKATAAVALFASLAPVATAHTWIEEFQAISPNGTYIGDRGFSRGYISRTDPTFAGDGNILWLLPALDARNSDATVRSRINSSDLLCHPNQRTSNYSNPEYPMLKATPGGYVAMKYLENGHVTLPWNIQGKPPAGGTVFVYGTTQPSDTEMIADVLQWNANGTGGDGRGFLMTTQNYDDGRCHQINDCVLSAERQVLFPNMIPDQPTSPGQEQWCETDLRIPLDQKPGKLTVYWVWQWPTDPNESCIVPEGKDEYYTTCSDFEIVDAGPGDEKIAQEVATNTLLQENFQTKAVSTYSSRTALVTDRPIVIADWKGTIGSTVTANSAFSSSCNASMVSAALTAVNNAASPSLPPSCPAGKWATGALFTSISSRVLAGLPVISNTAAPSSAMPAASTAAPIMTTSAPLTPTSAPSSSTAAPAAPPASNSAGGCSVTVVTTIVTVTAPATPAAPDTSAPAPPLPSGSTGFSTLSTVAAGTGSPAAVPTVGATGEIGERRRSDSGNLSDAYFSHRGRYARRLG